MSWMNNPVMMWNGNRITDHGRGPLSESVTRIGSDKRMADGTLRRQYIGIKRTWTVNWENIPSTNTATNGYKTADAGWSGEQIESFYRSTPGKFRLVLRRGSAINKTAPSPAESELPYQDSDFYIVNVMFTEFSKEVIKRGVSDIWNMSATLEEV